MPFPFLPGGAILAASVLIGALTVFGLILRAMDRAILGVRDMAVSGLVSGLRVWSQSHPLRDPIESGGASSGAWPRPDRPGRAATATGASIVATGARTMTFEPPEIIDLGTRPIEAPARRR